MMCEACKELSKVFDATQQLMLSKFSNAKTGTATFLLVQEKEFGNPQSVIIRVNYCPWCGEKLRKDGADNESNS